MFVGGIEVNKRARALSQGIKNADISLKGCIRMMQVASQAVGLPHAKVKYTLLQIEVNVN